MHPGISEILTWSDEEFVAADYALVRAALHQAYKRLKEAGEGPAWLRPYLDVADSVRDRLNHKAMNARWQRYFEE